MNRYHYAKGLIHCTACEKWLDPLLQSFEIFYDSTGRSFHKKRYCPIRTMYPSRLRYQSHCRSARIIRQEKATYY